MASAKPKDNTPWLKRILIPFWCIRIFLTGIILVVYLLALGLIGASGKRAGSWLAVAIVFFILIALCIGLDVTSIILFARDRLRPKIFLIFNVLQSAFWLAILIMEIVAAAQDGGTKAGVVLGLIILLSYLGLLIYASVMFHRSRKSGGAYQAAFNPGMPLSGGPVPYQPNQHAPSAYEPYASTGGGSGYELQNQPNPQVTGHTGTAGQFPPQQPQYYQQQQAFGASPYAPSQAQPQPYYSHPAQAQAPAQNPFSDPHTGK